MKAEKTQKESSSRTIQTESDREKVYMEDNRPEAVRQAKMIESIQRENNFLNSPIQKVERKTTTYARHPGNHNQWDKNMEIIDSTEPTDYVHISRSTNTDSEHFNVQEHNIPLGVEYVAAANRYEKRELAPEAHPHFNYALFNAANNGHITLEGRYMQTLKHLTMMGWDNKENIKLGTPVGEYDNLNFGNQNAITLLSIQNYVDQTATSAENYIQENYDEEMQQDLIEPLHEIHNSTLICVNQFINNTPYLHQLQMNHNLNHYGGHAWDLVWGE